MIRQEFTCLSCGTTQVAEYTGVLPTCCQVTMAGGQIQWPRGEENRDRYHIIKLHVDPVVEWNTQMPSAPEHVFEFWRLSPGRDKGEKIGYFGTHATIVEWKLTQGVSFRDTRGTARTGGFANTIEEAAGFMLEAVQGGVFAAHHIQTELA